MSSDDEEATEPPKSRKYNVDDFHPSVLNTVNTLNKVNSIFLGEAKTYKRSECVLCMNKLGTHLVTGANTTVKIPLESMAAIKEIIETAYEEEDFESGCNEASIYYNFFILSQCNKNLPVDVLPLPAITVKLVYDHFILHVPTQKSRIYKTYRNIGQILDKVESDCTIFKKIETVGGVKYLIDNKVASFYKSMAKLQLDFYEKISNKIKK